MPTAYIGLDWHRCSLRWCSLNIVDLREVNVEGVYIIWSAAQVVYVGQGSIKDRLNQHRMLDADVQRYENLMVTWAAVNAALRDGVERYLAEGLQPAVGKAYPGADPIPVNLPWDHR